MKHLLSGCACILLSVASLSTTSAQAQGTVRRHLVQFRDKAATPYSVGQPQQFLSARAIQRRQRQGIAVLARDLPPSPNYLQQVRGTGAAVVYRSRWFNGAVIECDSTTLSRVRGLACVVASQTLNRTNQNPRPPRAPRISALASRPLSPNPYGPAFQQAEQIDATTMHAAGFRGEGMQIAVFDAGFPGVNQIPAFQPLFQQNRIGSTYDFVDNDVTVYEKYEHGTEVLSCIGANQPNTFIGTAPNATFHLYITEDVTSEHPVEEANWLIAAEYADSVGVDIISSSLGYTTFDPPSDSYTNASMNGHTAISTRAADYACAAGIIVVNSAGNDGFAPWRYIGAPADGDSVLTAGAVDSLGNYAIFSSQGPTADGRIKPNLATQGAMTSVIAPNGLLFRGNGTSFSCPVLTGLVAGFWQANPTLTAQQVRQYLQQSASQAANPDNFLGYGIPNFRAAYNLANPSSPLGLPTTLGLSVPELFPNPVPGAAFAIRLPKRLVNQVLMVRLTDIVGRVVLEQQHTAVPGVDAININTSAGLLPRGAYLCQLTAASGESHTLRFVKE